MAQVAFVTRAPGTVAALRAARETTVAFGEQLAADLQDLGHNHGATGYAGLGRPEITGLKPLDPTDPPEGWRFSKSRGYLEPRRGKPGDAARQWLANHQPPQMATDLIGDHGAPTSVTLPNADGSLKICRPALLITDDAVHLLYEADPATQAERIGRTFSRGPAAPDDRWELEPLSAWHLALEAEEARQTAPAGVGA